MQIKTFSRISLIIILVLMAMPSMAQKDKKVEKEEKYESQFTVLKEVPHTPVKNQASSGTCWGFSGLGMLEAEILRLRGDTINLSEMFVVRQSYREKVIKYVRMHGKINLSEGGAFYDVLHACKEYGIVPGEIYKGLNYGDTTHSHRELSIILSSLGEGVTKGKKLTTAWVKALDGILDAYLGEYPEKFSYKGVEYTPKSFAKETKLNMDDYISISSFTHHPFYEQFILEIPDNWALALCYNLPMEEMMEIIDNSIEKGYTVAWASDVSEKSFSRDEATIPEEKSKETVGSDQALWTGQKETKKDKQAVVIVPEKIITQEMRQAAFDNYETTDDHGMLIVGVAQENKKGKFYKVKNSWGTSGGKYAGYLYVSVPFVQYKTTNIVVHKDAIPAKILEKLKL